MLMRIISSSKRVIVAAAILIATASGLSAQAPTANKKPIIRAITAFAKIDPSAVEESIASAAKMLKSAKASFEKSGYIVQTLRITTQPFQMVVRNMSREQILAFYRSLDASLTKEGIVAAIGPPFIHDPDHKQVEIFAEVLAKYTSLNGCILVADEKGISWPAVREAAFVMKYLEDHTAKGEGNFHFAAAASMDEYSPFFPTSYFLGPDHRFAIAMQGAGLVDEAFSSADADLHTAEDALAAILRRDLGPIQKLATEIEHATGWNYEGIDASTAPLQEVSIGAALEKLIGSPVGSPGTMTAAALITRVLKDAPALRTGFNGLMLPVLEDVRLAQRWSEGRLTIDSLLAYSAVCGTGLDTVPLPGDVTLDQLSRIIGDVAALSVKWKKPLSVRLFPVPGKKAGDRTEFDNPYLVNATIQRLP
jgi:uncharacterized protein (UPF0210 family)